MDEYLSAACSYLKLAEQTLQERLKRIEKRPVGYLLRRNQATHTIALVTLLREIRAIAEHDPNEWWENEEDVPF